MLLTKTSNAVIEQGEVKNAVFTHVRSQSYPYILKRAFDIIISLFFIVFILSWLTPIVALLILIDSKSHVFFRQRRVGRFGKSFTCYKFRTMHKNIEADFKQADEFDPRITRVGKFLRLTNIDELPQFFNVLIGDMSIVGPRPHMYKDCRDFNTVVKSYKLRTLVKPGITGLAQIKGYRGPTETFFSISHRFKWDLFYIKKVSALLDLYIIFTTASQTAVHFFEVVFSFLFSRRKASKNVPLQGKKQIAA